MADPVEQAIGALQVETPSWGFGDSGTRFATFPQCGRPRSVFERIDDAAEVNRLAGAAGAVALHFPWDAVDGLDAFSAHLTARGVAVGAINPNLFQHPDYKTGSLTNASDPVRKKAVAQLIECIETDSRLEAIAQSLCFADGTNYPGQDDLAARRQRLLESLREVYATHNVEAKVEAMTLSALNLQHAYAKALLVDREALSDAQADGDVLGGYQVLMAAYETDVRPLCARVREAKGAAPDPVAARESGYVLPKTVERVDDGVVSVGWGL